MCDDGTSVKGWLIKTDMDLQVLLIKIVNEKFTINSFDMSQDGQYVYLIIDSRGRFIEF